MVARLVGGESSWWRDDWIPQGDTAPKHLRAINHSRKIPLKDTLQSVVLNHIKLDASTTTLSALDCNQQI